VLAGFRDKTAGQGPVPNHPMGLKPDPAMNHSGRVRMVDQKKKRMVDRNRMAGTE